MTISRVNVAWTGPAVRGGGLTQLFFGSGSVDAQACVDAVGDFLNTVKAHWNSSNVATIDPIVTNIDELTGDLEGIVSTSPPGPFTGTDSGDPIPPSSQGLVRWFTGQVANNHLIRGRTFMPAITENDSTLGKPTTGYITAVEAAADALIADADSELVVWHRPTSVEIGRAHV